MIEITYFYRPQVSTEVLFQNDVHIRCSGWQC